MSTGVHVVYDRIDQNTAGPLIEGPDHTCKSCGYVFKGLYCNRCGEKVLEVKDRSFRSFLQNILLALTFTDNKFIKTLWLMVRNPGFVSKEYAEGRRVNYIKPLQVFFVLNLIYFLFPLLQLFNTSLRTQLYLRTHSKLVQSMVFSKVGKDPLILRGYELMYNEKSTGLAKLLIIVFVVLAAVPMAIIYRKRNRYFTDHVTLAVELTAFNLAVNAILLSLFLMLTNAVLHMTHMGWEKYLDDTTLTVIFILTNSYFLFAAGRTFYHQRGKMLLLKILLGLLGLFVALEVYRLILFLITFWSL
ncbi:MAG TPA: DUF3667 domain-containing protein [Chryseosolibacter sp.]